MLSVVDAVSFYVIFALPFFCMVEYCNRTSMESNEKQTQQGNKGLNLIYKINEKE